MAKKKAKPAATKKPTVKKKAKKAAVKKAVAKSAAEPQQGIPCICIKVKKRWFCMKEVDGTLIQCDGPFETEAECNSHQCF